MGFVNIIWYVLGCYILFSTGSNVFVMFVGIGKKYKPALVYGITISASYVCISIGNCMVNITVTIILKLNETVIVFFSNPA